MDSDAYTTNSEFRAVQEIRRVTHILWSQDRWLKQVVDDAGQWKLIKVRQASVKYPDYLELVGPPSETDYDEDGQLTASRKAELMLIGMFHWQGFSFARHALQSSWRSWDVPANNEGWYVATEPLLDEDQLTAESFFDPLQFYECV